MLLPYQQRAVGYDPVHLIDSVIALLQLKNDAALCRRLNVSRPVVSKIRRCMVPVSASILLRMHEEAGLSVRELMGDRRRKYGYSRLHKNRMGRIKKRHLQCNGDVR